MQYDEMELDKTGDRKTAAFFIISDTNPTFNFIVALAFSQLFNLLCERADTKYGGRLPYSLRLVVMTNNIFVLSCNVSFPNNIFYKSLLIAHNIN